MGCGWEMHRGGSALPRSFPWARAFSCEMRYCCDVPRVRRHTTQTQTCGEKPCVLMWHNISNFPFPRSWILMRAVCTHSFSHWEASTCEAVSLQASVGQTKWSGGHVAFVACFISVTRLHHNSPSNQFLHHIKSECGKWMEKYVPKLIIYAIKHS